MRNFFRFLLAVTLLGVTSDTWATSITMYVTNTVNAAQDSGTGNFSYHFYWQNRTTGARSLVCQKTSATALATVSCGGSGWTPPNVINLEIWRGGAPPSLGGSGVLVATNVADVTTNSWVTFAHTSGQQFYTFTTNIVNSSPYKQWYQVAYGGFTNWISLNPYETGTISGTSTNSGTAQIWNVDCNGCWHTGSPMVSTPLVGGGAGEGFSSTTTPPPNLATNLANLPTPASTNTGAVFNQVGNALLTQMQADRAQERTENQAILDAINDNQGGGAFDDSAMLAELEKIRNNTTNQSAAAGYKADMLSGIANNTNWAGAQSVVQGILDGAGTLTGIDSLSDKFIAPVVPAAAESDWSMVFAGVTINLNPVAQFPLAADASYWGFTFILYVTFGFFVVKLFWKAIESMRSQQTGGVPNLEVSAAGFGGNVAGIVLAAVICFVFVAGWAIAIKVATEYLLGGVLDSMHFGDFTTAMSGKAWYLLCSFFPVSTAISLLFTRIGLEFTVGKVILLAAGVSRFLFGK